MSWRSPVALPVALLATGLVFADDAQSSRSSSDTQKTSRSRPRIRLGGIYVNAGYSHFSGPFYPFYPYYGPYYGAYRWGAWGYPFLFDPFLYGSYFHPGFWTGFGYRPSLGEVKLKTDNPDAWVYLDGALAGKADKLKNIWLEPGAYNLEVRSGDKRSSQRVYVLSGKTLRLTADTARGELRP